MKELQGRLLKGNMRKFIQDQNFLLMPDTVK